MIFKVGNKEYIGQCNALSYIFHKRLFKISIFNEIDNLKALLISITQGKNIEDDSMLFYESIKRVIYTFLYTNSKEINLFENWEKQIKNKDITENIINEVIEILLTSFIDEEVNEKLEKLLDKGKESKEIFPEHSYLKICLKFGLSIECLKELTYIDTMKVFISSIDEEKSEKTSYVKKATQQDIDRFLG